MPRDTFLVLHGIYVFTGVDNHLLICSTSGNCLKQTYNYQHFTKLTFYRGNAVPHKFRKSVFLNPIHAYSMRMNYYWPGKLRQAVLSVLCLLLLPALAFAQDRTLSGTISSPAEGPIPGASIIVKGTQLGTTTDMDGNFTLRVPEDAETLLISYIGYKSQEVAIGNQTTFNITMEEDLQQLSEVVVVGYGTQERRDLTGAVSSVGSEEFKDMAINSVEQGLQGRVAGVNIVQQSGQPGAAMQVQIRGIGSIGNSEPLWVIDGIPIINDNGATGDGASNALASINPNDIESIEILKDASAAAIYGARAANGVVMVTTKRGSAGKTTISLDAYTGFQEAWRLLELTDIDGYKELSDELSENANLPRVTALQIPEELVNATDWQDEIFQTAPINNINLTVSGGSEDARFSVSGNYMDQEGILIESGFERMSLKVNTDFNKGKFKFGQSMQLSRTVFDPFTGGIANTTLPPNRPVLDPDAPGGFAGPRIIDEQDRENPVGNAVLRQNTTTRYRALGSIYGEYEIIDGLSYRLNLGIDFIYGNRYQYTPPFRYGDRRQQPFATLTEQNAYTLSPLLENTLNYNKNFGKHTVGAVVGYTRQTFERRNAVAEGRNTNNSLVRVLDGVNDVPAVAGSLQEFSLVSYLGRFTYDFDGRYLLTANIRRDGSSRFSEGNKWGVFPSFSLGWRISEEDFFNVPIISDLKLRGSWGQTGFQEIGNYTFQTVLANTVNYIFNNQQSTGVAQRNLASPNVRWETSTQTDIGLDLGMLDNRLLINMDYYVKETDDILVPVPASVSTGIAGAPTVNAGSVRNSGFEFMATYRKSFGDFRYNISANIATLQNEVLSLGGGQPIIGGDVNVTRVTRIIEGEPIGHFFGYVTDGIFQTQGEVDAHAQQPNARPGDIRFRDLNDDGVINELDKANIGDPIPDLTFGFNLSASYKNFDLSIFGQGVEGVDLYYGYRYFYEGMLRTFNFERRTLNRWTGPGTTNEIPRAVGADPADNTRESDRFLGDGSFFRIRNATLGYNLPVERLDSWTKGTVSSARIYVTAQNLFTFTTYEGYDPEIGAQSNDPDNFSRGRGIDGANYPQARTFMLGAQINF